MMTWSNYDGNATEYKVKQSLCHGG